MNATVIIHKFIYFLLFQKILIFFKNGKTLDVMKRTTLLHQHNFSYKKYDIRKSEVTPLDVPNTCTMHSDRFLEQNKLDSNPTVYIFKFKTIVKKIQSTM